MPDPFDASLYAVDKHAPVRWCDSGHDNASCACHQSSQWICQWIGYGWSVIDHGQAVGCDKQRAGTPKHGHGVPALPLVTPYTFTNWPAMMNRSGDRTPEDCKCPMWRNPRLTLEPGRLHRHNGGSLRNSPAASRKAD